MSQIEELQGRITNALDRISQGLDLQANTQADPEEVAALRQALDEERTAAQQLSERNKSLNERIETLESELTELKAKETGTEDVSLPDLYEKFGASVKEARDANDALQATVVKLREANAAQSGEPHLINSGMRTELESMKSARALDRAEMMAILETLEAVLEPSQSEQEGA